MRAVAVVAVAVVVALAGCFSPSPPAGAPCSADLTCPTSLVCTGGACVAPTGGAQDGCTCTDAETLTCGSAVTTCAVGCDPVALDRCLELVPSNGVDPSVLAGLSTAITIDGPSTLDTDTGEITGALTRAAGPGVIANIDYVQTTSGGAPLGVFAMASLTISAKLTLVGSRAAVLLVGTDAVISGIVDGGAGCGKNDPTCPGAGGSVGTAAGGTAIGCDGGAGGHDPVSTADGGGGGGGGGKLGGAGGIESFSGMALVTGTAGVACMAPTLEPLVGGGGGGAGGPGAEPATAPGAGGGALQLTALRSIAISGQILMNGGGGPGGVADPAGTNAGGGAGGGAGGALLLESLTVEVDGVLAANGGGGGGGGANENVGGAGADGNTMTIAQGGGAALAASGRGGNGGFAMFPARSGAPNALTTSGNSGGGGGAVGQIFARAVGTPTITGTPSPMPGVGTIVTR